MDALYSVQEHPLSFKEFHKLKLQWRVWGLLVLRAFLLC